MLDPRELIREKREGGTHRPDVAVEIEGLDIPEMGCLGYCGVVMDKASESPTSK